jgi:hypothetical protein
MEIKEYLKYRKELLDQSQDDEGFFQESLLLSEILPSMLDAKLIDSEDTSNAYFKTADKLKVNAYCLNESGERLQIFVINDDSTGLNTVEEQLQVSTKSIYEAQFKRSISFLKKAIKRHLNEEIQDSSPVRPLISKLSSAQGLDQIDVVEIFLISLTATVSLRGTSPQPNRLEFDSEEIPVKYSLNRVEKNKNLLVKKSLVDLNFLYNVLISQGNREALKVDFNKMFGTTLNAIKAADEENFESYLCVLPAEIISGLYKDFSTRLLEKNVRSFLQFKGVNKGIRETIRKEPEKFVAYNNGLTITATSAEISTVNNVVGIKSLTDFQIVNGGQTTATIYFTQKDGFDISKVKVMAKINVAKGTSDEELEDLISNISIFSNAQSRVSKVDLGSRNPQLVKIKSLSESVMTPSGVKWFFERAKGEFNTKLRIAGSNKNRLAKDYPPERRFSKELMAKYFSAWGNQPHLVKKGGEKIFRYFIERLTGEGDYKKPLNINRDFYEELIAKIILFRKLEKIYGSGKNSMGQLRSAAVPYSLSVLYNLTDGNKKGPSFDLLHVWKNQGLEDDLETFFTGLLEMVNDLIKKYSESEDYGEYSKKAVLWETIDRSKEITEFCEDRFTQDIIAKYGISKDDLKARKGLNAAQNEIDFHEINSTVLLYTNGADYYNEIRLKAQGQLDSIELRKLEKIINLINTNKVIEPSLIEFEQKIIHKIRKNHPEVFDEINVDFNYTHNKTLEFIIGKYNKCLSENIKIETEFKKIESIASAKKVKYASVFGEIGKKLANGEAPNIKDLNYASNYFGETVDASEKTTIENVQLSDFLLRRMIDWEAKNNTLTPKEKGYLTDLTFGFKKRNDFHDNNLMRHLKNMVLKGFKLD